MTLCLKESITSAQFVNIRGCVLGKIYKIDIKYNFLSVLAEQIIAWSQEKNIDLSEIRVFLPTQRAVRILKNELLQLSTNNYTIFPKIDTFSPNNTEELFWNFNIDIANLNTEYSKNRLFIIANLVEQYMNKQLNMQLSKVSILSLSQELCSLIDDFYRFNISSDTLYNIEMNNDISSLWQNHLEFLKII